MIASTWRVAWGCAGCARRGKRKQMATLTIPRSAAVLALIVVFTSAAGPPPPPRNSPARGVLLEARVSREVANQQAHNVELVGHAGGSFEDLAVDGSYVYLAMGPKVVALDVSSPSRPRPVGQIGPLANLVASLAVGGGLLYVGTADAGGRGDAGLHIFDVANPAEPIELGSFRPIGRRAETIALAGPHAYVMSGGLRVLDVSDPTNPVEIGFAARPLFGAVVVADGYAYASSSFGGEPGVFIFDVSDPTNPTEVGRLPSVDKVLEVADGAAYATSPGDHLLVFDVSSPATPIQVGSYPAQVANRRSVRRVRALGDQLYVIGASVTGANGIAQYNWDVLDVSDRASPTPLGHYEAAGFARGLAVAGSYAYVASDGPHHSTLDVIDISDPAGPTQVGSYSTLGEVSGVALGARHAYVISGETHLAGGRTVGLTILDVADSTRALPVGFLELTGRPGGVAVSGNYAYVAAEWAGFHVVDVSDPARPIHVANFPASATGVAASGRAAVITFGFGTIRVFDVSDPAHPLLPSIRLRGQGPIKLAGSHAYIAADNGFRIVDLSAPDRPAHIGSFPTPRPILALDVADGYAVIYGDFGVWIVDVSDPGSPNRAGDYAIGYSVAAVAVAGDYAYLRVAGGGLRVLNISSPSQPREVGFYPLVAGRSSDIQSFPGLVAAQDHVYAPARHLGLFILKPTG